MQPFNLNPFKINKDFVIVTCIVLLPFVFYIYNFAPLTKTWNNLLFEIDSGLFEDVNYYLWYLSVKLLTIFIITLWYLSCTQRWRNILFIPIIFELFKFFNVIKATKFVAQPDDISIIETLCYSTPYIIMLLLISKKINYYKPYNNGVIPLNNEINNQIIKLSDFDKKQYKSVKEDLRLLDVQKGNMDKKEYLKQLVILRDQLTIIN
jgi:hypothetical protein